MIYSGDGSAKSADCRRNRIISPGWPGKSDTFHMIHRWRGGCSRNPLRNVDDDGGVDDEDGGGSRASALNYKVKTVGERRYKCDYYTRVG